VYSMCRGAPCEMSSLTPAVYVIFVWQLAVAVVYQYVDNMYSTYVHISESVNKFISWHLSQNATP
jgi:hypothetical protein